jgi:hypothetical protein
VVKRARKAEQPSAPAGKQPVWRAVAVLVTLGLVAALLFGLSRVGDEARREVARRERYTVRFADIRCEPPPRLSRETFLAEVRYNAKADATFQSLDPDLPAKLTACFASHPWVAGVDAVTVESPEVVSVKLTYRTPVLGVKVGRHSRAVDAKGILLPGSAPTASLPELLGVEALPAETPAGKPVPNDLIVRAAAVAAEYKPKTIERTEQGWQLVQPDGKKLQVGR